MHVTYTNTSIVYVVYNAHGRQGYVYIYVYIPGLATAPGKARLSMLPMSRP